MPAPTGRNKSAQRNALGGKAGNASQALKGRDNAGVVPPFQGLRRRWPMLPRALPCSVELLLVRQAIKKCSVPPLSLRDGRIQFLVTACFWAQSSAFGAVEGRQKTVDPDRTASTLFRRPLTVLTRTILLVSEPSKESPEQVSAQPGRVNDTTFRAGSPNTSRPGSSHFARFPIASRHPRSALTSTPEITGHG